jgi:hypothetical protein
MFVRFIAPGSNTHPHLGEQFFNVDPYGSESEILNYLLSWLTVRTLLPRVAATLLI